MDGHQKRALAGLVGILAALVGACDAPFAPIPPGSTGYVSDRAVELAVVVSGSAPPGATGDALAEALRAAEEALAGRGWDVPLADAPASVVWSGRAYEARVETTLLADPDALPPEVDDGLRLGVPLADGAHAAVRLTRLGPRDGAVDVGALVTDGRLEVAALFGQMDVDGLAPGDDGYRSRAWFEDALTAWGFAGQGATDLAPDARRFVGRVAGVTVTVDVLGPESFSLAGGDEALAARLRATIASHALVYVDGHSFQPSLAALADPAAYAPARARLLVLDLCWSYQLYVRGALEAASGGLPLLVVSSAERVTTGSVESFAVLFGGLLVALESSDAPSWRALLADMNSAAEARAALRRDEGVAAKLRAAELYGVSGLASRSLGSRQAPLGGGLPNVTSRARRTARSCD